LLRRLAVSRRRTPTGMGNCRPKRPLLKGGARRAGVCLAGPRPLLRHSREIPAYAPMSMPPPSCPMQPLTVGVRVPLTPTYLRPRSSFRHSARSEAKTRNPPRILPNHLCRQRTVPCLLPKLSGRLPGTDWKGILATIIFTQRPCSRRRGSWRKTMRCAIGRGTLSNPVRTVWNSKRSCFKLPRALPP